MSNKVHFRVAIFAMALSIVAILLAGFSYVKAAKGGLGETEFMAKVEKGIEKYIAKQREKADAPIPVSLDDDAVKGDEKAPVTIVEFSDFECPYCSKFYKNTLPKIISEYVDKGKVKFVYRDYPLAFHSHSKSAAIAAECAGEQGGDKVYYKYHNKLYENQSSLGKESYTKWAKELNLKTAEFNKCLDSEKMASEVEKDLKEGGSYGVTGTPAFFINGRRISGAQPFDVFKNVIDEELTK